VFGVLEFEGQEGAGEHPLTHAQTGLGRAPANDIRLDHPTVSRFHARIVSDSRGSRIIDLGSGNGTLVDGLELEPRVECPLADGAHIRIGPFDLVFRGPQTGVAGPGEAAAGRASAGAATTVLLAPPAPPRLRVTTPQGVSEAPLLGTSLSLGRDPGNDIVVDSEAVSRRHARLEKRDAGWLISDLGSTNGLRYHDGLVKALLLKHGDTLRIGRSVVLEFLDPAPAREGAAPAREGAAPAPSRARVLALPAEGPLVLGRSEQADVTLSHPAVSRAHARIVPAADGFYLQDLGSSTGTYVNGEPVARRLLRDGDVLRIGSSRMVLEEGRLRVVDEEGDLRLDALHLSRVVGKGVRILEDVSLSIYAQEFVAIVGASGSGKSTLLNALCGFHPATTGRVLLNGTDLYRNFGAYRNDLGYVPQDDIIHRELPVQRALDYAARLRMPADTSAQERRQRVFEVLEDLDLGTCSGRPVRQLSGGQRKRVSMGVELLTRPSLFFLDEATSGLDPGTESQMMRLLRRLADQGRTVALVTHATKNVMMCDRVVFLARGGLLAFYGPPHDALRHFQVDDFDEIYTRLESEDPREWSDRYRRSSYYKDNVEQRLAEVEAVAVADAAAAAAGAPPPTAAATAVARLPAAAPAPPTVSPPRRVANYRQFAILSLRYLDTIWRDKKTAALLLSIAPLLGLLDFVVWQRDIFDLQTGSATQAVIMLFMVAIITILIGTVTSVREIVKEDAVYRRERMVGLRVLPYVGSKVAVGFLFALYSALMLFVFKLLAIDFSHLSGGETMLLLVPIVLGTFAGVMWGLLVSAVAPSEDRAMLLVILVLVPQFVFSGGMLPVADLGIAGKVLGWVTSTRWELGALVTSARIERGPGQAVDLSDVALPGIEGLPGPQEKMALVGSLRDQYGDIFHVNLPLYWGMSFALALALFVLVVFLQKRKDTL
jgi:ABC-type multidrug transport system ATPase subunit/predicted component of type VI protein secretion system